MKRYTGSDTPRGANNALSGVTPRCVWGALKALAPHNTEKKLADALSKRGGEDISPRTVSGWRYKIPSGRHVFLILTTWPELIGHFREPASARQAKYDAAEARHEKLQAQGTGHGKRDEEWDNEEPCGD